MDLDAQSAGRNEAPLEEGCATADGQDLPMGEDGAQEVDGNRAGEMRVDEEIREPSMALYSALEESSGTARAREVTVGPPLFRSRRSHPLTCSVRGR
eukprot:s2448_g3.t1